MGTQNSYVGSIWCATGYCEENPFQSNSSRHRGRDNEKEKSSKSSATYLLRTSVTSQDHRFNKSWMKQGVKSLARFEDSRRKSLDQTRPSSHRTKTYRRARRDLDCLVTYYQQIVRGVPMKPAQKLESFTHKTCKD